MAKHISFSHKIYGRALFIIMALTLNPVIVLKAFSQVASPANGGAATPSPTPALSAPTPVNNSMPASPAQSPSLAPSQNPPNANPSANPNSLSVPLTPNVPSGPAVPAGQPSTLQNPSPAGRVPRPRNPKAIPSNRSGRDNLEEHRRVTGARPDRGLTPDEAQSLPLRSNVQTGTENLEVDPD